MLNLIFQNPPFRGFIPKTPDNIPFGDKSKYYKLQPFAIALYTCQGIPMLWQGQEFAENYFLPNNARFTPNSSPP
ncbi:MAG: hypothetical protein V7L23_18575 [Nostoc sp.]|uniref:hypothetical protein n=1 Tax=Nostoc sp. TaxID=1180 RepID=UPI002FEF90B5